MSKGKVTIIGSGIIGRCWAVIFAKAGYRVCLYDVVEQQLAAALQSTTDQLREFERNGVLSTCHVKDAETASTLISSCTNLEEAMSGAKYLQECVPESVSLKKKVFCEIDRFASDDIILASSSSCIGPSQFTAELTHKKQCLVAHPVNPPYFLKLVEVVPSPATDPDVTARAVEILKDIGQEPVVVKKEVNGFLVNRLQYAVIMEAWRLVEDGVCSAEDVDKTFTDGLAPRWSLIGPFETMHLNADGVEDYCGRYGATIEAVCSEQQNVRSLSGETMSSVHEAMCRTTPVSKLAERRRWRDSRLAALAAHVAQQKEKGN